MTATPRLDYSRISPRLLAGRMPFAPSHVEALAREDVTAVVNLCEQREYWDGEREEVAAAYRQHGIVEHHLPVCDGATVPRAVLDAASALASGETVYVHCRGGRERSAAVTVAMIAAAEDVSIERALELAVAARPAFCPLPWQLEALRAWPARAD